MYGRSSLKISGRLSYDRIAELLLDKPEVLIAEGRSKNYGLRSREYIHPVSDEYERAMCMRLYRTDILQFFRDGTVIVNDWDSNITRSCTSEHGPFSVGVEHGQQVFRDIYGDWWPMDRAIVVLPDGTVQNVIVKVRDEIRVKPELKAERRRIGEHFRNACFARLVLGEFPKLVGFDGYASAPDGHEARRELFRLLDAQADHADIARCATNTSPLGRACYGRVGRATKHADPIGATEALINCLLRAELGDPKWFNTKTVRTEHRNIRVRAA
jgi:hypothetical protein